MYEGVRSDQVVNSKAENSTGLKTQNAQKINKPTVQRLVGSEEHPGVIIAVQLDYFCRYRGVILTTNVRKVHEMLPPRLKACWLL